MTRYILNTPEQQAAMLKTIGVQSVDQLYRDLPKSLILTDGLDLPEGLSEFAVMDELKRLASLNKTYDLILRGAGAEHHLIPSVVRHMSQREEFVTAYTPYQSEFSQGILQSIFEYQTSICELTGMDASNASVYDGASAAAEAVAMVLEKNRRTFLVPANLNPQVLTTIKTYTQFQQVELVPIACPDGIIDENDLKAKLSASTAGILIQHPNYLGLLEDVESLAQLVHGAGGKVIVYTHPTTLGLLKSPRAMGADIAVGEAQPLGIPLSYGGPYLGFMAASAELVRRLPGRIAGQTVDTQGRRAFALTLQAREQHIRREKASSSLCSNQALMALTASMYLAAVGPDGLREVAEACLSKAHAFAKDLQELGLKLKYQHPFFHEFVTVSDMDSTEVETLLGTHGILSGLPLSDHEILWCVTESARKADLDRVIAILKEAQA